MQTNKANAASKIKVSHAIYPILIGVVVVGYMFYKNFNPAIFDDITLNLKSVLWLLVAVAMMFSRDLFYIIRLRILSEGNITWGEAFRVIMLWEFTSAITPSAVGGTSVAILYVHKAGLSIGRSSTIVMLTSFFDELYFIIMFPLLLLLVGADNLFNLWSASEGIARSLMTFAVVGYSLKAAYVLILSYGFFINPRGIKWVLMKVFSLRFLKRWRVSVNNIGTDIILSSKTIRHKPLSFWIKAFSATFFSWSSRYFVANALIIALFALSDNVLMFARQLVMWIMMLVMPTPGGSGFAEYIFTTYCRDLIIAPEALQLSAITLIAFLWRAVTYYPYLAIGAIIFPRWFLQNFTNAKSRKRNL